jgi:DNA repair ATPase RecN
MIEQIRIKNFQAHEDLTIEMDRVVTLTGPSDVGKSSAIRALRWAALNVPVSSLIRDGAKQASVELIVDGRKIVRSRGSENVYQLDGQEYKAFRTDVPDAIAKLLNMTEVNFQGQHDPIYWFSSTAGDVSRQLNAVVDLSIIDATLAETVRMFNKAKTVVQIAEETLSRSVAERDGLAWVADADADLKKVEESEAEMEHIRGRKIDLDLLVGLAKRNGMDARELKSLADDSASLLAAMGRAGKASKQASDLKQLVADVSKARDEKSVEIPDLSRLAGLADDLVEIGRQKKASRLAELIASVRRADADKAASEVPDTSQLDVLAELLENRTARRKQLETALDETRDRNDDAADAKRAFKKAHQELESKTEGLCPLCGREMEG